MPCHLQAPENRPRPHLFPSLHASSDYPNSPLLFGLAGSCTAAEPHSTSTERKSRGVQVATQEQYLFRSLSWTWCSERDCPGWVQGPRRWVTRRWVTLGQALQKQRCSLTHKVIHESKLPGNRALLQGRGRVCPASPRSTSVWQGAKSKSF